MHKKIQQLIDFIRESKIETSRVTWPTKEAIIGGTAVVILVSLALVIYMGILDFIIVRLLNLLIR